MLCAKAGKIQQIKWSVVFYDPNILCNFGVECVQYVLYDTIHQVE